MTSERADQGATPANHHSHPGATLAAQREAMGWSVEQVAEQLKLAVRQVVAIEAGDYAALPSPAVTRGFIRAYAKIVRLDPAPLVAMVKVDEPVATDLDAAAARRERPTSFSESRFPTHGRRSSLPLGWIAAVVVVAAAAGAAWNFGLIKLPGGDAAATGDAIQTVPADGAATNSGAEAAHDPAVPLISVPAQGDTNAAPANGAPTAPAGQAPAATPPAVQTAPATPTTTAPAPTAPAANAPAAIVTAPAAAPAPAGANTLVLSVREDSWIEVRPQGGKALISRLVKAGSLETVEVPGTATLVVGNPAGVTATLRGAAVALPQVPGKTISRVTLNK